MPGESDEAVELAADEAGERSQLERLLHWAPAALFAVAVAVGLVTYLLNPIGDRERPKEPQAYYHAGLQALEAVRRPSRILSRAEQERQLLAAQVNFARLRRHYSGELDAFRFDYVNPHLLLAESSRLLAGYTGVAARREALLRTAREAYANALRLEERSREGTPRKLWEQQFKTDQEVPGVDEVAVRKARRRKYIQYHRGLVNLQLGYDAVAREQFEALREEFFRAEMERLRREREGKGPGAAVRSYRPIDFELLPADKVALHYHLARAYDEAGETEAAEREYRVFLLQAERSAERFGAWMRLAAIAHQRGSDLLRRADRRVGREREALVRQAEERFRSAAEMYAGVVEESAPEEYLRRAYFEGGIAYLSVAEVMDVGQGTSWDVLRRKGQWLEERLRGLSGRPLPRRARWLPAAVGAALLQDAARAPEPVGGPLRLLLGGGLVLATRDRITPKDERQALLAKARSFLDASASGPGGGYLAESRVMIGRSLLVEESTDKARRLLGHAMEAYPRPAIRAGALWGVGRSYLKEARLNEAWQSYRRLPPAEELPATELVSVAEIRRDLVALGRAFMERAEQLAFPEEWVRGAVAGSMQWQEALGRARGQREALERATEVHEALQERYDPPGTETRLTIANLYARRARLLSRPPFGSSADRLAARDLRMRAADTYETVALENPTADSAEEALRQAGLLFFASEAYERCAEALEVFRRRHGRSDRISEVRNVLGQAYQRLGLYERAELVFRRNVSGNTAGRKALYHLGRNYLDWSLVEEDRRHLGGPESPLLREHRLQREPEELLLRREEIVNWEKLVASLRRQGDSSADTPGAHVWELLDEDIRQRIENRVAGQEFSAELTEAVLAELNRLLQQSNLYEPTAWRRVELPALAVDLLRQGISQLPAVDLVRLNRLLLHAAFPETVEVGRQRVIEENLPHTAREVFEYVRRQPGMTPVSRPWRWSTFALGETFFEIARHLRRQAAAPPADEEAAEERGVEYLEAASLHYRRAAEIFREALKRYVLYHPQRRPQGLRRDDAPEDYLDIQRSRYRATYLLGLTYEALGESGRAQEQFRAMLDDGLYDPEMFFEDGEPVVRLRRLHRNAYLHLGMSLYREGAYAAAYDVYEEAQEALESSDGPYILYMMGECLRQQGDLEQARNKYVQARHAAQSAPAPAEGAFAEEFGTEYWTRLNEERLNDLEYLRSLQGNRAGP
jgi:TolA-binding protein